jgi:hypothetical protein
VTISDGEWRCATSAVHRPTCRVRKARRYSIHDKGEDGAPEQPGALRMWRSPASNKTVSPAKHGGQKPQAKRRHLSCPTTQRRVLVDRRLISSTVSDLRERPPWLPPPCWNRGQGGLYGVGPHPRRPCDTRFGCLGRDLNDYRRQDVLCSGCGRMAVVGRAGIKRAAAVMPRFCQETLGIVLKG